MLSWNGQSYQFDQIMWICSCTITVLDRIYQTESPANTKRHSCVVEPVYHQMGVSDQYP